MKMQLQQLSKPICVALAFASVITCALAAPPEYGRGDSLYVISSAASVRAEPHDVARISAKFPIGTKIHYKGTAQELARRTYESESCPNPNKVDSDRWLCIGIDDFAEWGGWISIDVVGRKEPQLDDLIAQYDKTPKEDQLERRKWAERALGLDPLSVEAQTRLLDILYEIGDQVAHAATKRSIATYQNPQSNVTRSRKKFVFALSGGDYTQESGQYRTKKDGLRFIEPIADLKSEKWMDEGFYARPDINYDYRKRGQIYFLYSRGFQVGTVITEAQFDCATKNCPQQTLVRAIWSPEVNDRASGLVMPFVLPARALSSANLAQDQKLKLQEIAETWVKNSAWSAKEKRAFISGMRKGQLSTSMEVAQLSSDGRVALIGSWALGSMNDQHYGGPEDIHLALLIIAEQRPDGKFQLARGSGSLTEDGCQYFDHADIDGDGTDEIALHCTQLEGSYDYRWVKRLNGVWKQ